MTTIDETESHYVELYNNKRCIHPFYIVLALFSITLFFFGTFDKLSIARLLSRYSRFAVNDNICPLHGKKWIVVTTTFYPTPAIHKFLNLTTHWNLIVIGNKKTPKDWLEHLTINSSRLLFLSFEKQNNLSFRILHYLPDESYARKNLGYLIAIKCGAQIIFESDDDNLLEKDDIYLLPKIVQPKEVPWIAFHRQRSSFINIYGSFGHPKISPRGFPITEIRNVSEDGWHSVKQNSDNNTYAYIQQYLADLDPDVDAIYRLAYPLPTERIEFDRNQPPIAVQPFTFSPYNTQNTVTYYEAFWGLYLPITTTFRVCDIWRGFWVQRLLWDIGGRLIFGTSTVKQIRNNYSYVNDMDDEYQLNNQSSSFVRFLASWSSSDSLLSRRITQLAKDIAQAGFWDSKEIDIMNAWLADLHSVGYSFPSIMIPSSSLSSSTTIKRAAICVTGLTECIQEAWVPTYDTIRHRFQGDIDTFLFLSSSLREGPVPLSTRLQQVRSYRNSTVTIIYEDGVVDPGIPSNCTIIYSPEISGGRQARTFQQVWGLSKCFDLVKEYEQKMNIRYEYLIRARTDSVLERVPDTLEPQNTSTIIVPAEHHSGGYNDRFAIGSMSLMEKYMRRWHTFRACHIQNLHPESFLKLILNLFGVTVQPVDTISYIEIPHGSCH